MGNFIDLSRNIEYNEVFDEDFTKLPPNTRLFKVTFPEAMVLEYICAVVKCRLKILLASFCFKTSQSYKYKILQESSHTKQSKSNIYINKWRTGIDESTLFLR